MIRTGLFLSVIVGSAFPLAIFVFRLVVNDFMKPNIADTARDIYKTAIWFGVISLGTFVFALLQNILISVAASRQTQRIRLLFLKVSCNHCLIHLLNCALECVHLLLNLYESDARYIKNDDMALERLTIRKLYQ